MDFKRYYLYFLKRGICYAMFPILGILAYSFRIKKKTIVFWYFAKETRYDDKAISRIKLQNFSVYRKQTSRSISRGQQRNYQFSTQKVNEKFIVDTNKTKYINCIIEEVRKLFLVSKSFLFSVKQHTLVFFKFFQIRT